MAVKKRKTAAKRESPYCVYLGPTLRGVIESGRVFSGSVEAALASLPEHARTAEIRGLIVPAEDIPDAMRRLREGGGLIGQYYRRLARRGL